MRIPVDPPTSDARRDRVEKQLFAQLAAVRLADRAEAVIPPVHKSRVVYGLSFAGLAAAALVLYLVVGRDRAPGNTIAESPSRIVTPVGGESRVTIEGAIIDAKSDTSVEVQRGPNGATTLVLSRGTIDCQVDPRGARPPFRVKSGEVTVEVVGTRFSVARTPGTRIDVAHGTVRVTAPGGSWLVEAGESWPMQMQTATIEPAPPVDEPAADVSPTKKPAKAAPVVEEKHAPAVEPAPAEPTRRERERESYRLAQQLEATDPPKAASLYRAIATEGKHLAATALISLAELELKQKDPAAALAAAEEHAKRFPHATTAEDAAWLRYKALLSLGKRDEARGAADDYLRQFPSGTYAERLRTR